MINTLFYFAASEAEYQAHRQEVGANTIVFCKAENTIWKGGLRYGGDGTVVHIDPNTSSISYAINDSSTQHPTNESDWLSERPEAQQGRYLWTRDITAYTDGTYTITYGVVYFPLDGAGTEIDRERTYIRYSTQKTQLRPNVDTFTLNEPPELEIGDWLWVLNRVTYVGGTPLDSYSVSRVGDDGAKGDPGADGYTTHFAYATSADGIENFSTSNFLGATYIGTCRDNQEYDPGYDAETPEEIAEAAALYIWTKWKGDNGQDGINYEYVYLRTKLEIAPVLDSTQTDTMGRMFIHDEYLPIATNGEDIHAAQTSNRYQFTDDPMGVSEEWPYEWQALRKKINGTWQAFTNATLHRSYGKEGPEGPEGPVGPQGPTGPVGPQGPEGKEGTGINIKDSLDSIEELENIDTATLNVGDSYMVGDDLYMYKGNGQWKNVGRIRGEAGESNYINVAWCNDPSTNPVTDFATSNPQNVTFEYMGIYISNTENDPLIQVGSSYEWTKIKGVDGTSPIFADITNEMDSVACDYEGNTMAAFSSSVVVSAWRGSTPLPLESITVSENTNISVSKTTATGLITFSVSKGASIAKVNKFTITLGIDGLPNQTLHYTLNGVRGGQDGEPAVIYSLVPSATDIVKKKNGTRIPSGNITCVVVKNIGGVQSVPDPSEYTLITKADGVVKQSSTVASSSIIESLVYELQVNNVIVDKETIPVISDGVDGGQGENAYRLDLDNQYDSILYQADGITKVDENASVGTTIRMYNGGTDVTDSSTLTISSQEGTSSAVLDDNELTVDSISSDATVLIRGEYPRNSKKYQYATFTVKKLISTDKFDLIVTPNSVSVNTSNTVPATTISVQVRRTPSTAEVTPHLVSFNSGSNDYGLSLSVIDSNNNALTETTASGNVTTRTFNLTSALASSISSVTVRVTKGGITQDVETIPVSQVRDGQDGSGANAVKIDLDNEMDAIPCDSDGVVTATTTLSTRARIYNGASPVTSGVTVKSAGSLASKTASTSVSSGVATISWTIPSGTNLGASNYTSDIVLTWNSKDYYATFSAAVVRSGEPGLSPVIYQLLPSTDNIAFSRDANNNLTPNSVTVTMQVSKSTADGDSTVTIAASGLSVRYTTGNSNESAPSSASSGTAWPNAGLSVSSSVSYNSIYVAAFNSAGVCIDRETIAIVKDGAKGLLDEDKLNEIEGDIDDIQSDMGDVQTKVGNIANYDTNGRVTSLKQYMATAVENTISGTYSGYSDNLGKPYTLSRLFSKVNSNTAFVETESGKDYAETSMVSKIVDEDGNIKAAEILTAVNADDSSVKIKASKITLTGETVVNAINGGNTTINGDKITTGSITANQIDSTNLQVNADNINLNGHVWADTLTADLIIGKMNDDQTRTLTLDADTVNIAGVTITASQVSDFESSAKGAITAAYVNTLELNSTKGKVGGWSIGANQLSAGSGASYVGLNSAASGDNSAYAIWAGNGTPASAPFSVTKAGKLTATGAVISGNITASSLELTGNASVPAAKINGKLEASQIKAEDLTVNKLVASGTTGNAISVGTANNGVYPFSVTNAGKLTATGVDITGAITATSLTIGTGVKVPYSSISDAPAIPDVSGKMDTSQFTPANIISKINDTTNTTTIDGGKITTGSITASQIKANTITANELASKTITADQIATGAITTDKIAASAITAAKIDTTDLTVKKLRADNATNNKNVTVVNGDGISVTQNGAIGFQANADGSGSAARGNISWTTNGTLSVNGAITATSLVIGEGVSVPYSKLSGTPTIPTKTSQLTNDSSYATTSQIPDISGKMDSSSFTLGNIIKAINGNTNTTTIDGGKITTGSITATQIDATNLQVAAANITGTLTASQINTAGLSVAAANITGKLTASQIDATNLQVAAANITGTLTASLINTANLHVSAANIDGTIAAGTLAASKSFTSGGIALTGHTEITGDGFVNYVTRDGVSGKSNMNAINLDGSGYLANNKISWDASGNFQLGNNAIQYDASNSRLSISAYNVAMQSLLIQDLETTGGLIVGSDTTINGELSVQGIVTSGIECSGDISGSTFSATSTSRATGYPVTKTTAISSSSWSITNTSTINQQSIKTEVNITPSAFVMTSKVNNATEKEQIKLNINGSGSLASGNISWTTAGVLSTKGLSVTGDSTSNSVYSNCLYVHDADANDIFLAESDGTISFIGENTGVSFDDGAYITGDLPVRGTVEANALQIKYNNTVVGGIDVSGLITGKNLSIVGNSTGKIIVSYGAQDVRVTPSSYSISDSSSSSAATLTSTYLSVAKSGNTAKLSIDSSGNIELVGSVTSGSSVGNSIWPTVTRDTTASTPTKGRVYAITLGDLKTMIQDSTGTYSTKYGNWSVMLTRTA